MPRCSCHKGRGRLSRSRRRSADPVCLQRGERRVRQFAQNLCPKLVKPREKPFPGRPPLPPTLPEILLKFALGPKCRELSSFLVDFCTPQKSFKKCILQNAPKNLKSRTLDRPNGDFGMTFGVHLGIDFHEILDFVIICENHRNACI